MILGVGTDLADIGRIGRALDRFGSRFTHRCFTPGERLTAARRGRPANRYALFFAAKEAAAKALGTGFRHGVYWRDLEVIHLPGGQPAMRLTGGAAARLAFLTPPGMVPQISLSLTDEGRLAHAVVVMAAVPGGAVSTPPPAPTTNQA